MSTVVEFDNVSKVFPGPRKAPVVHAVQDVSLTIEQGSIVGIIGFSGAGKSTLVRLINGLETQTSGTVRVLGVDVGSANEASLRALRGRIGMIFQQFNLFNSRTVRGNIAYPLKVAGWKKDAIDRRVDELLDFVGIRDKADQHPRRLSGGQKQRVGIARAIATNPELLLADEATSALDPHTTAEVLALLREINRRLGITIVVITHQMSIVHELCDHVVVMEGGSIVDAGNTYRVFAKPQAALTKRFVASVTQGVPSGDTLAALLRGGGVLVSVDVNEFTSEDVAAVFHAHGVHGAVVYGGVTDVLGRQLGTLTYRLHIDDTTARAVVADLRAHTEAVLLTDADVVQPAIASAPAAAPADVDGRGEQEDAR